HLLQDIISVERTEHATVPNEREQRLAMIVIDPTEFVTAPVHLNQLPSGDARSPSPLSSRPRRPMRRMSPERSPPTPPPPKQRNRGTPSDRCPATSQRLAGGIRTHDPRHPKTVRFQTAPRPDAANLSGPGRDRRTRRRQPPTNEATTHQPQRMKPHRCHDAAAMHPHRSRRVPTVT